MKTAVEQVESLQYKLCMFGVPLEGPTNMFCDSEAVFKYASIPDSTLKKKHTSICYHRCREAVASHTVRVAKEGTLTNLSDMFTKPMPQANCEAILDRFTYRVDPISRIIQNSRGPNRFGWFRVVVPSDVFSSECQACVGSCLAIRRVRA